MNWQTYSDRYERELLESIIPFWENNSIDKKYGGFFTYLDRDGSVYDMDKYMWMQWRIVYIFATLYNSKYKKDSWLDIAINGYNFLTKNGVDSSGNSYFALNRKGEPIIAPYNIFSEAFAMMGSAALFKATSEEKYKTSAVRTMNNYVKQFDNPKGKWDKSMFARKRRLNLRTYMILANLGIIARDCLNNNDYFSPSNVGG